MTQQAVVGSSSNMLWHSRHCGAASRASATLRQRHSQSAIPSDPPWLRQLSSVSPTGNDPAASRWGGSCTIGFPLCTNSLRVRPRRLIAVSSSKPDTHAGLRQLVQLVLAGFGAQITWGSLPAGVKVENGQVCTHERGEGIGA